jgi:preprotein translocase subunit SecG
MHTPTIIWIFGGAAILCALGILILLRRGRADDLGSVSAAWTTEHNIGDRGGDRSNG